MFEILIFLKCFCSMYFYLITFNDLPNVDYLKIMKVIKSTKFGRQKVLNRFYLILIKVKVRLPFHFWIIKFPIISRKLDNPYLKLVIQIRIINEKQWIWVRNANQATTNPLEHNNYIVMAKGTLHLFGQVVGFHQGALDCVQLQ